MDSSRRAKTLRQKAPLSEAKLWNLLRGRRLAGLKFRRQVPIGPYTVDFLCLRHRLVVEADGPFHDGVRDAERDRGLGREGFRVLRFTNSQIAAADWVLGQILGAIEAPLDPKR